MTYSLDRPNTRSALFTLILDEARLPYSPLSKTAPPPIAVAPVYVFSPESSSVPAPSLVTPPVPPITPEKVVPPEFTVVSWREPRLTELPVLPVKAPIV